MKAGIFSTLQIIFGAVLIVLVLLQAKGTGLGSAFGGEMGFYKTKRGFEKLLFQLTIVIATLFLLVSLIGLIV
ncbi:MAG: Preprotein translocase, SecG subunit [Candidatus Daviesbacteria bacterium GW2011_GWB1_41_5]|uniref:Protein-export membrane protein SecG n=1 Tax=Candidatus Daviesbacteria bacterium GW2011_GWB1_41_5 TaxID=1618429 RepID=A0A0G0WMI9_9BACT|nr:MAG: Preprotein translocase, SecG subunit [Candidatus Daviesbacteria bacterium GW2011_GWB1_41_5]